MTANACAHSSFGKRWLILILFFCVSAEAQIANSMRGILGEGVLGESGNNVVLVNSTGLKVVRVKINDRTYEDIENKADKILVNVSPKKHHMELFFKGGAHIDWPGFNFYGIHEIIFTLAGNRVVANPK